MDKERSVSSFVLWSDEIKMKMCGPSDVPLVWRKKREAFNTARTPSNMMEGVQCFGGVFQPMGQTLSKKMASCGEKKGKYQSACRETWPLAALNPPTRQCSEKCRQKGEEVVERKQHQGSLLILRSWRSSRKRNHFKIPVKI